MFKLLNIPELSIILNITSNSNDIYIELTIVSNIYSNLVKSLKFFGYFNLQMVSLCFIFHLYLCLI